MKQSSFHQKSTKFYRFQHPPVRVTGERASTRDIHDDVTHWKEQLEHLGCEGLREEVGKVRRTAHERYGNVVSFNALALEEVSPVDVLRTLIMQTEVGEQGAQVDNLFGRLGGSYNFRFA
eukprot:6183641-Pleurochrysis_carterae.AAC.2